jgi:hypothetical protein
MAKQQSISAIRKQLRLHAAQSNTFATLNKSSIEIRSVAGVLVMDFAESERKDIADMLQKIEDKKLVKTIV